MAKNKVTDLRDHLFAALEGLTDPDTPMDLDRAHAVCEVAQTIINSAKVEIDLVKAVSGSAPGSGFFDVPSESKQHPKIAAAGGVSRDAAWAKPKDGAA